MAHVGANIGAAVAYLPLPAFKYLRNDWQKRELIAAGVSAGVSSAFGAPVGGALFAYEMSKPNTFWRFGVLWKAFFSCSIAVVVQTMIRKLMTTGTANDVSAVHELKFKATFVDSPDLTTIPAAIILGVICGILGAFFIYVNTTLNKQRKKYITKNWQKLLEVALFSIATSSTFYWAPSLFSYCESNSKIAKENKDLLSRYDCGENEHSPIATMFENEELGAIRSILSAFDGEGGIEIPAYQMLTYLGVWYFFTITTYGVWVPAGLFLPGIIVGAALGWIYESIN
jgi:chloride channel 7